MEFHEKIQILRKNRGMTQEELAEALFVSRTAVSKWESGRGYPSIDSLKEISGFFSITIDDLLSGEKLLSIAEREKQFGIRRVCELLFGMTDLFSLLLIVLPLYPKTVNGYIYSVSLSAYTEATTLNRMAYWILFLALILTGILKILLNTTEKKQDAVTACSMVLGALTVLLLALAGETYAVAMAFLLLLVKGALLMKTMKQKSI
ncbi:MAG: helix-turn-helix transcriptional regulator [Clostridia bacterium]|nr:helix-turn-helix transcriptional regulator [Clostridia bacterium]